MLTQEQRATMSAMWLGVGTDGKALGNATLTIVISIVTRNRLRQKIAITKFGRDPIPQTNSMRGQVGGRRHPCP